jgi:DNA repair protein RadC
MTKIKDIPINDRPIERLIEKGSESLSNEELLAILLRTGSKGSSAKDLASNILSKMHHIKELKNMRLEELKKINGVGTSKAAIIISMIELSKRMNQEVDEIVLKKANHPELLFQYYKAKLEDKAQEYFYVVYLDTAKKIIKDKLLFIGTINYSLVHPREIFKEAYLVGASSIILIHNHPTGNVIPSKNDIDTTNQLIEVGHLLGINVVDHIIIGKHNYYSFYENKDI